MARETEGVRAAWDRVAPGYDRFVTPMHMALAEEGLRRAGLGAGARFLDVAAGSGALSIPAARMGAHVLAVDLSSAMLSSLRERAAREGLEIETSAMDGHALDLDDDSFDMAGSQFGVMLFPDMPRGIREMARVVRPGGRVLVHAFTDPPRIEFLSFFFEGVRAVRPGFTGFPADQPPLPLQLADPQRLRRELEAAGLRDVTVEPVIEKLECRSGAELWDWLVSSNPIVESVLSGLGLAPRERDAVRARLGELVRERAGAGETATLTVPVNIGIGTK